MLALRQGNCGLKMARPATYSECIKPRDIGPEDDFTSVLPVEAKVAVDGFKGTNHVRASATEMKNLKKTTSAFAGSPGKAKKVSTDRGLSGEVWKDGSDPQNNTIAQRSWVYGEDAAIKWKLKGFPTLKYEDIEPTGLNIGQEHHKKYDPEGHYHRVAVITKSNDMAASNARHGTHVFMDE
jgi:hypothetical protein